MNKIKQLFLFVLTFSLFFQCKDDDGKIQATDPYEGCCGTSPVVFTAGNAKLYLPNAFTPNDDGINDVFFPNFNDKVSKIELLSVFTPELGVI